MHLQINSILQHVICKNNFSDEDVTVESSQSSSLIHMSVVESGHGVRRSSVVVIEHVDMTPVPSRASEGGSDPDMDVNTHIFV